MTDNDETQEIEQLRRRVSELEGELETARSPGAPGVGATAEGHSHGRWRAVVAATLITLSCVLAPLSVTAVWANRQVSDTNRYVETVAPLAHDPAIQSAIATRVTQEVLARVDVNAITAQTLDAISKLNLPPRAAAGLAALQVPIVNGVENFTASEVAKVVASPQFATVWAQANRAAHAQLVNLLSGKQNGAVTTQNGAVTLNLAPIVAKVKQQLIADGYTVANNIPTVNKSFVLVRSDAITKAQGLYRLLDTLGTWLPVIALLLLGIGVYVARDHRRALLLGSLGVVASMLVLGVVLAVVRPLYLNAVPTDVLPREAAGNVFDTLVHFLRTGLRTTGVLFLVVAVGAFFTGPAPAATRTRRALGGAIASLGSGAEARGLRTGPVGPWTYAHKRALRIAVVVAGALTLTLWSRPSIAVVLWTAVFVLIGIGLVELLGRPSVTPVPVGAGLDREPAVPRQREPAVPAAPASETPADEPTTEIPVEAPADPGRFTRGG